MGIAFLGIWILSAGQLTPDALTVPAPLALAQSQPAADTTLRFTGCGVVGLTDESKLTLSTGRSGLGKARSAVSAVIGGGVAVVGRLVPSTNIAAQAGNIDPTTTAMAIAEMRNALGDVPLRTKRLITPLRLPFNAPCATP